MDCDIVVALVGNENTLKRYFVDAENKQIRLHSENKIMMDIIVPECEIQGVAVDRYFITKYPYAGAIMRKKI